MSSCFGAPHVALGCPTLLLGCPTLVWGAPPCAVSSTMIDVLSQNHTGLSTLPKQNYKPNSLSLQIEFKGVKMRYRPGLPLVLKGLDVCIEAGTTCGVVGRTGINHPFHFAICMPCLACSHMACSDFASEWIIRLMLLLLPDCCAELIR